jgi:hypothetical protein
MAGSRVLDEAFKASADDQRPAGIQQPEEAEIAAAGCHLNHELPAAKS